MDKWKPLAPPHIGDDQLVTVTYAGIYVIVTKLLYRNTKPVCKKKDKDYYEYLDGSLKECSHERTPETIYKGLRSSLNKLGYIIDANFTDPSRCLFVTLTYKEKLTDLEKLDNDWENFCKRFKRKWGKFKYIMVLEPQKRGAWHLHILMFFDEEAPDIENHSLQKVWTHGFVFVQKVTQNKFRFYFTKKLKTLKKQLEENDELLALFRRGMHIFRCSRGIKRPEREVMTNREAKNLVNCMTKVENESYNGFIFDDKKQQFVNYFDVGRYINSNGMNKKKIEHCKKYRYFKWIEESQVEEIKKINEENHLTHEEQEQNENNVSVTIFRKYEKKNNTKIETRIKNRIYWQIKAHTLMFSKPIYLLTARLRR